MLLFAYLCFLSLALAATLVCLAVCWPNGRRFSRKNGSLAQLTSREEVGNLEVAHSAGDEPCIDALPQARPQDPLTEFKLDIHRARSTARRVFPTFTDAHRRAALIECAGLASELLSEIDDDEMVVLGQHLLDRDDSFKALMDPKSVPLLCGNAPKTGRYRPAQFSYLEAAE